VRGEKKMKNKTKNQRVKKEVRALVVFSGVSEITGSLSKGER